MCWYRRKIILTGVVVIAFIVVCFQVLGAKWGDVCIIHYDGKILADQRFDPVLCTGAEIPKHGKSFVRAYYRHIPGNRAAKQPVTKADLNGKIRIRYKGMINGKRVEQWKLEGSLDGDIKVVVPRVENVEDGVSCEVNGWSVEWWKRSEESLVIIITNPEGRSRTFKIQWYSK